MQRINNFIKKSVIGGLLVISPITILYFGFRWAFETVTRLIAPLAKMLAQYTSAPSQLVDVMVILLILTGCFLVGSIVTTSAGMWLHARFDNTLARLAPGYNLVKEIINQFFGDNAKLSFSQGQVARAKLFGAEIPTEITGIVTSHHENGWYTLFVPTGPNPTSGMIYHLPPEQVKIMPGIKVDEALRTIIACGAGSGELFSKHQKPIRSN